MYMEKAKIQTYKHTQTDRQTENKGTRKHGRKEWEDDVGGGRNNK